MKIPSFTSYLPVLGSFTLALILQAPVRAASISVVSDLAGVPSDAFPFTFESGQFPSNYIVSGSGAGIAVGSVKDYYLDIGFGPYAYVEPGSSIAISFDPNVDAFGFLWGSPDSYNSVSVTTVDGQTTIFDNAGLSIPGLVLGTPNSQYVEFQSDIPFSSVKFTTTVPAFEFDNLFEIPSSNTNAPEPGTGALFACSLLAIATGIVKRRRIHKK